MPRTRMESRRNTEKERKKDNMEQKKRKENEIPGVITSQGSVKEPVKKRSKLVLPSPQISESELKKVIKVEQDNEYTRQQTEEAGKEDSASRGLLQEYSVTPGHMRTPWTLATQDTILQGPSHAVLGQTRARRRPSGAARTEPQRLLEMQEIEKITTLNKLESARRTLQGQEAAIAQSTQWLYARIAEKNNLQCKIRKKVGDLANICAEYLALDATSGEDSDAGV